ncbi:hypothetical protein [Leyella stercorea]|nr:hypothetical protein [Leyella stercorea]
MDNKVMIGNLEHHGGVVAGESTLATRKVGQQREGRISPSADRSIREDD